jgi:hypothetical protein
MQKAKIAGDDVKITSKTTIHRIPTAGNSIMETINNVNI